MVKTTAILLRKTPLTDTSLIIHWCSAEHGLIKTAAKGAKRPGSSFAGRLDLFYESEIVYASARRGDLHTLKEVHVIDYHHGLQASYLRVLAGSYFVKLIEQVAEPSSPIPVLYDLLKRAVKWLCETEPTLKGVLHFETELAKDLGLWSGEDTTPAIRLIQNVIHQIPEQRLQLLERVGK